MSYNPDPRLGPHNPWPQAGAGYYGPAQATVYGTPPPAHGAYPYPYRQAPARKSRGGLWIGVTVLLGVVVVLGVMAATFIGGGSVEVSDNLGAQAEQILDDNLEVDSDGDGTKKFTNYGMAHGELPVKLTNKGDEKASFTVTFDVISKSGMVISDATASVTDLAPGQSVTTTATFSSFLDADEVKLRITDVSMS